MIETKETDLERHKRKQKEAVCPAMKAWHQRCIDHLEQKLPDPDNPPSDQKAVEKL